jgi:hypothetical protein
MGEGGYGDGRVWELVQEAYGVLRREPARVGDGVVWVVDAGDHGVRVIRKGNVRNRR